MFIVLSLFSEFVSYIISDVLVDGHLLFSSHFWLSMS